VYPREERRLTTRNEDDDERGQQQPQCMLLLQFKFYILHVLLLVSGMKWSTLAFHESRQATENGVWWSTAKRRSHWPEQPRTSGDISLISGLLLFVPFESCLSVGGSSLLSARFTSPDRSDGESGVWSSAKKPLTGAAANKWRYLADFWFVVVCSFWIKLSQWIWISFFGVMGLARLRLLLSVCHGDRSAEATRSMRSTGEEKRGQTIRRRNLRALVLGNESLYVRCFYYR
jgi:hypothetical protein